MLLAWSEMAVEVGLEVEQLYATEVQRFSVRVSGCCWWMRRWWLLMGWGGQQMLIFRQRPLIPLLLLTPITYSRLTILFGSRGASWTMKKTLNGEGFRVFKSQFWSLVNLANHLHRVVDCAL